MDNSINFKGAFYIKRPTVELTNNLHKVLSNENGKYKRGIQIIKNMSNTGDVLYVVRDSFDKNISNVLLNTKNAKFRFYPGVNTKFGFDDQQPVEAKNILQKAAKKIIDKKYELENYFKPKIKKPVDIVKIQARNLKIIQDKTFIDVSGSEYKTNIDHQTGVCSVYTMIENPKTKKKDLRHKLVSITPPDKFGISYARINPIRSSNNDGMRRLAIQSNDVIFEYDVLGLKTFVGNEVAAKQHYIDVMTKYREDLQAFKKV